MEKPGGYMEKAGQLRWKGDREKQGKTWAQLFHRTVGSHESDVTTSRQITNAHHKRHLIFKSDRLER